MTFERQRVVCDGCQISNISLEEFENPVGTAHEWMKVCPNVRGHELVLTYCLRCARTGVKLPTADEIVSRVKKILR